MPEPGQPQRATLRSYEHQVVGGPRTGQLLGQGLDHDPGEPDTPVASSGLGRPEMQVAADLGDDLSDLDHPMLQVNAASDVEPEQPLVAGLGVLGRSSTVARRHRAYQSASYLAGTSWCA